MVNKYVRYNVMGKKAVSLLICVLSLAFMLFGCGENNNSEIVGEWVPTTATLNGSTIKYDELEIEKEKFGFVFTDDGKCTATLAGINDESSYTFNGTSVDIQINGEDYKLDYEKGNLTLSLNYGGEYTSFTFTKAR